MSGINNIIIAGVAHRCLSEDMRSLARMLASGDVLLVERTRPVELPELVIKQMDCKFPALDLSELTKPKEPWRRGRPLR